MGHEASVTKKRVLGKVEQCIEAANLAVSGVEELRTVHNAFTQKVGEELAARDKRLGAQGAMLVAVEARVGLVDRRSLDTNAGITDEILPKLATIEGSLRHEIARVSQTYGEFAELREDVRAFTSMPFFQRLRYLFTGRWPRPLRPGEGIHHGTTGILDGSLQGPTARELGLRGPYL